MDWHKAIKEMTDLAEQTSKWKFGQKNTIRWMSNRLKEQTGILIADEVGMGKTRIAMAAILAVMEAGGSVAVVVPPGLIYQWKKEWEEFLKSIGNKEQDTKSSNEPIMLRSYYSLFEDNNLQFPLAQNAGRWLLISHQFGPPLLRNDARPRRYMLPVLVKALIDVNKGKHKSNSYWQLVKKLYKDNEECIGGTYCPSNNKENKAMDCPVKIKKDVDCNELPQINKAANYLVELVENGKSLFDTDDLPFRSLESAKAKEDFKKYFNDEKHGLKMINKLLGSIDLLIIDEAHKNRDVEDDPKRLGIILRNIITPNDAAKKIALTATPMELNAHQWKEAFIRIGEEKNYPESAITEFVNAHKEANKHPDNNKKINDLITASKEFVKKLEHYVTRRMRTKQKEMRDLIGEERCKEKAHPHREWKPIEIDYNKIEDKWKPSVFALEAIGKAAKGCITDDKDLNRLLGRLKIADSRYAAGKISSSGIDSGNRETDGSEKDESNDQQKLNEAINKYIENNKLDKIGDNNEYNRHSYIQGKLRRIQCWKSVLESNNADLAGHPRIRFTADEIEKILWDANGQLKQEKVLVFGTFLEPLESLCDVLNRRTVLRLLDRKKSEDEPPIPGKEKCLENIEGIWAEYQRMKSCLSRDNLSKEELESAIKAGGKSYESLRDRLRKHINELFVATLPGDAAIKSIEDKVAELLRSRLVNDIICSGLGFKQFEDDDTINIKTKALDIWCEYLKSFFDKWDDGNDPNHKRQPKTVWEKHDYFTGNEEKIKELIELDNFADYIGKEALNELLEEELDHLSGRSGMFARMLSGDVKMETRRVLQAQFNDENSFPKVLIAQSQVGREGLNLHKACSIVVQFHSEWNPGIIEQQIGRVDRIDSLWEKKVNEWKNKGEQGEIPKITVIPVIFKGTYDSFQYGVSKKRRENLNAHLFGELFSDEALEKLSKDAALREELKTAAPSFDPKSYDV